MTDERSTKAGSTERARNAGDGKPAAPLQRRMSAQRKQEAVLRVLRGEGLVLVSRDLGVTAVALSGWRDSFLAAGTASLKSRPEHNGTGSCGRCAKRSARSRWRMSSWRRMSTPTGISVNVPPAA